MDHPFVEQHDVVTRYLRRSLPPGETQDFEAHFIDCPECLDALERERDLRDAMKRVLPVTASRPRHLAGWLAAAAVFALAVAGGAAYLQMRRALADSSSRVQVLEQQVADAHARAEAPPAVAIFELTDTDVTRSAGGASDTTVVAVPASASLVVLSLQVQNADAYRQFGAELFAGAPTRDEGSVWKADPLFQSSPSSVGIAVPSAVLRPGVYHVTLKGVMPDGRSLEVGRFPFRITAR
jgi:hypothetical protein